MKLAFLEWFSLLFSYVLVLALCLVGIFPLVLVYDGGFSLGDVLVFMRFFPCVFYLGLCTSPWCLALGFGDTLGGCISWMEDPSLVLCIVCWRSSLGIVHWGLEIFPWLMHWDLWFVFILRFVDWSLGFLCLSLVWWSLWDCWRSLRVSSERNLIRVSWKET